MTEIIQFIHENTSLYYKCIEQHLLMSLITMIIALLIGIPVGYICAKNDRASVGILMTINTFRIIPAIAIFMIFIPFTGLGMLPSVLALTIYAVPAIVVNTMGAIKNVKPSIIESAIAMGMGSRAICFKIEFPLALPMILTGVRISTVETIAGATIAAFVGGGGLGQIVYMGILSNKIGPLFAGSFTVAALVILVDAFSTLMQSLFVKDYR